MILSLKCLPVPVVMTSKRWSCGSIMDGFHDVLGDACQDDELAIQKQIEDHYKLFISKKGIVSVLIYKIIPG